MNGESRHSRSVRISLELALDLLAEARVQASAREVDIGFAALDPSGVPVLSARTGNASFAALDLAVDKAYTAAAWRSPTSAWSTLSAPGAPGWGLAGSLQGRALVLAGGVPIWDTDGSFLGGLGISGGTPAQDEQLAHDALSACHLTPAPPRQDEIDRPPERLTK